MSEPVCRGDVIVVRFDPAVGFEIRKQRPAVVVSSDSENWKGTNFLVTVIPLSTMRGDRNARRDEVVVESNASGLESPSVTAINQLRSIDRNRIVRRLGRVSLMELSSIENRLQRLLQLFQ